MLNLAGAKALRTDIHFFLVAADLNAHSLDVGIPDPVGSSVRMADIISEMSTFSANLTLCHDNTSNDLYYFGNYPGRSMKFPILNSYKSSKMNLTRSPRAKQH